jgi:hypothetical protein
MAAQVKFIAYVPRKGKDKEYDQPYGLDANQGFFCGVGFLGLVAPNEMMPYMSRDHESWATDDGNHVMVPNPSEMISTTALVTKASTQVLKPQNADGILDLWYGEVQPQVRLPQSFVLTYTILNPIGVSTLGGVLRKTPSYIPRSKAPASLMGMVKVVCQAPLFYVKTLAISNIQPTAMFHLVATLCENGGTLKVMVRWEDTFVPSTIPR